MAATEWAETHRCPADGAYAAWGEPDLYGEGMDSIAGVGAPLVAEFAPVYLGRQVALATRDLPVEAAGSADRLLTRDPARLTRAATVVVSPPA